MLTISPPQQQQQWPRGPVNGLHLAALNGSTERTLTLLASGAFDIDQGTEKGITPLMWASMRGHSRVAGILLTKGANVLIADCDRGYTALHFSAGGGHAHVAKQLLNAGSLPLLEAICSPCGSTPLHLAASEGHSEMAVVLIEAGANPNSRRLNDEATPLFMAAKEGHVDVIKVLLLAGANPLLPVTAYGQRLPLIPLDGAAVSGHSEVVQELIQQFGIEGCGGPSGGTHALMLADNTRITGMRIIRMLTAAGVVDTGLALLAAASTCSEEAIQFLLQQRENQSSMERASYVNFRDPYSHSTALVTSIEVASYSSARFIRLLIEAGADTTSVIRVLADFQGSVRSNDTPLALTALYLHERTIQGKDATREQLHSLEATRRLLMRVEAVHAVSWLWPSETPVSSIANFASASATKPKTNLTRRITPKWQRRAKGPSVLGAALYRCSKKLDGAFVGFEG